MMLNKLVKFCVCIMVYIFVIVYVLVWIVGGGDGWLFLVIAVIFLSGYGRFVYLRYYYFIG